MKLKFMFSFLILLKLSFAFLQPSVENSYFQNECVCNSGSDEDMKNAIKKTIDDIEKVRIAEMIPGVVAGISIKGKDVMTEAFGQTDIENDVKTHKDSVWRLASISKSLTTLMIGRLIEKGLIDLEKSIHHYLSPKIFPIKQWNNKNVTITVKQVMSHTAGLRVTKTLEDFKKIYNFKNVTQTLEQFKDDPLICEPGTSFNYSNYGFQIIGAIIESVLNETYENAMNKMFKELGMNSTFAERHEMIIHRRARYYLENKYYSYFVENLNVSKAEVLNAPIIDDLVSLEAQWPSGGLVSTVPDLLKFGNHMLKSYKGVVDAKIGMDPCLILI
jgi:CubicO group peptidase (beta-lactamase class C family)